MGGYRPQNNSEADSEGLVIPAKREVARRSGEVRPAALVIAEGYKIKLD